jgi:hypothetical protein
VRKSIGCAVVLHAAYCWLSTARPIAGIVRLIIARIAIAGGRQLDPALRAAPDFIGDTPPFVFETIRGDSDGEVALGGVTEPNFPLFCWFSLPPRWGDIVAGPRICPQTNSPKITILRLEIVPIRTRAYYHSRQGELIGTGILLQRRAY